MGKHVLVAGTFDHIHKGHEAILMAALSKGTDITIALTSDTYIKEYKYGSFHTFDKRKKQIEAWLQDRIKDKNGTIISIDDPYEPAVSGSFDAIVVSVQTRPRADEINEKRQIRGLKALEIIEIPMVLAEDGSLISSTRIKDGVIDGKGRLMMPDSLRDELIRPVGRLLVSDDEIHHAIADLQGKTVISVGDITTTRLLKEKVSLSLAIVDLMVQRKAFTTFDTYGFTPNVRILRVASGPGFISDTAIEAVSDWAIDTKAGRNIPYAVIVAGEEDLLVLPVIVASPVGAVVFYGQPPGVWGQHGLVMVTVTKELQIRIHEILSRFISAKEE